MTGDTKRTGESYQPRPGGRTIDIVCRSPRGLVTKNGLPRNNAVATANYRGMRRAKISSAMSAALLASALVTLPAPAAGTQLTVDPDAGNSAFTAVFDAVIGERITAVSSAVGCTIEADEAKLVGSAKCSVPLTSIQVDNDETKSEHFAEWATNKASEPKSCRLEVIIDRLQLAPPVEPKKPVAFSTEGRFTICGRRRDDGGAERITGTIVDLPAGTYGDARTLRIRARIEGFDRERYGVGPKNTAGWRARVQQLAPVVATEGTIEVNLFATAPVVGEAKAE